MTLGIEAEVAMLEPSLCPLADGAAGAPENRADAKRELVEDIRLRDEVIGTELEATEQVLLVVASGHDEDRSVVLRANLAQHLDPVRRS